MDGEERIEGKEMKGFNLPWMFFKGRGKELGAFLPLQTTHF